MEIKWIILSHVLHCCPTQFNKNLQIFRNIKTLLIIFVVLITPFPQRLIAKFIMIITRDEQLPKTIWRLMFGYRFSTSAYILNSKKLIKIKIIFLSASYGKSLLLRIAKLGKLKFINSLWIDFPMSIFVIEAPKKKL